MKTLVGLSLLLSLALPSNILANDSAAGLAVGGLTLKKNTDITMVSEDLVLSESEVSVDYVFENTTAKDITTIVAFPLPTYKVTPEISALSFNWESKDPLKFSIAVDGKSVPFSIDRKVTELPAVPEMSKSFNVAFTYFWEQTFPAKKRINVSHHYRPALTSTLIDPSEPIDKDYCADRTFLKMLKKRQNPKKPSVLFAQELAYVLTTGNNWKGPIGTFKLTIRKSFPKQILSLCTESKIKKLNQTDFVIQEKNYRPKQDLKILFIS